MFSLLASALFVVGIYSQCDSYTCPDDIGKGTSKNIKCESSTYGVTCTTFTDEATACCAVADVVGTSVPVNTAFGAVCVETDLPCTTPTPVTSSPVSSPVVSPATHSCDAFDCSSGTGRCASGTGDYSCVDPTSSTCIDYASDCDACCSLYDVSSTYYQTAFDATCSNAICPSSPGDGDCSIYDCESSCSTYGDLSVICTGGGYTDCTEHANECAACCTAEEIWAQSGFLSVQGIYDGVCPLTLWDVCPDTPSDACSSCSDPAVTFDDGTANNNWCCIDNTATYAVELTSEDCKNCYKLSNTEYTCTSTFSGLLACEIPSDTTDTPITTTAPQTTTNMDQTSTTDHRCEHSQNPRLNCPDDDECSDSDYSIEIEISFEACAIACYEGARDLWITNAKQCIIQQIEDYDISVPDLVLLYNSIQDIDIQVNSNSSAVFSVELQFKFCGTKQKMKQLYEAFIDNYTAIAAALNECDLDASVLVDDTGFGCIDDFSFSMVCEDDDGDEWCNLSYGNKGNKNTISVGLTSAIAGIAGYNMIN